MTKSRFLVLGALLSLSAPAFAAEEAPAFVTVNPSFYSFGTVARGDSRSVVVQFQNFSSESIPFFNAYCSGDFSAFDCSPTCFSLPAYGSCSVYVRFTPRNGDGMIRTLQVHGYGGGWYQSSYLQGTERKDDGAY
jgi:hypothetical protein